MSNYKPPYSITSKILKLSSNISELIADIKYIDKNYNTLTLRKKNRVRSITGTLQIEGNSFDEAKVTNVFHYEFEFIHPFADGNGRIGRLWQTVILKEFKDFFVHIPIESLVRANQERYYKALEDSGSLGESTPFIEFMLEIMEKSLQDYIEESKKEDKKSDQKSRQKSDQKILLLMKKNRNITIDEISEKLSMSGSGVKKVIKKLKDENRVKRVGSLKGGHWEIL